MRRSAVLSLPLQLVFPGYRLARPATRIWIFKVVCLLIVLVYYAKHEQTLANRTKPGLSFQL
jgi:hypothetical protein